MRCIFRRSLVVSAVFLLFLLASAVAQAEPLKFSSSTQFLWGDDLLGESQQILAQYLRMSYVPEGKTFSLTGYGRVWKDFGTPEVRDNDVQTRLYYLYLDYSPVKQISARLGRQFVNFTAGTSLLDGARLDVSDIGPVGITIAGGRDVIYTLDSEVNRDGNYFVGVDVHLTGVANTQAGISYARKYDESDLAREELGANFRYNFKRIVSPYIELKYDVTSEVFDEATLGVEVYPMDKLMLKGEFYHSYPTFDATSIYSVFAVDKYREYMIGAEYEISKPVSIFASYVKQTYEEDSNADVVRVGARLLPMEKLSVNASLDYRNGYGGNIWGFEVAGNYRLNETIAVAGGIQYDSYRRPAIDGKNDAQRYWIGGRWIATKNISLTARIEENVNEVFDHRTLGRVALNWNL